MAIAEGIGEKPEANGMESKPLPAAGESRVGILQNLLTGHLDMPSGRIG